MKEDIDGIKGFARNLLNDCELKEPPLNLDTVYQHLKLTRHGQYFRDGGSWGSIILSQKVRAILDVREKLVLINFNAHEKQQIFASVHEAGHFSLPWQKEILYICSYWDLDERTKKLFEREANIFAAEALFFSNLFIKEALDLPFGMNSVIYLAGRYNVSLESAGRRYVEESPYPCALLVCRPVKSDNLLDLPSTELIYFPKSNTFKISFKKPQLFPPQHVISKACSSSGDIYSGYLIISGVKLYYESLFTTYRVLTLVGEANLFKQG